MAKAKKAFNDETGNDILVFTPEAGVKVDIRKIATAVLKEMKKRNLEAEIRFPRFTIEVEHGTTVQDIVDAYEEGLRLTPDVNANRKPGRKPKGPEADLIL